MKYHAIDNSLKNLGKTVLWQYDRAVRLLSIMKHMQVLYHCAVEQFWDFWREKVLAIDTCGALGCSIWGIFLGVPRPTVRGEDGKDRLIATAVYRRVLKGAFYLMKSSSTFESLLGYLEIVFGVGGEENLSKWSVYVSEYGWTTNIDELNDLYQSGRSYNQGDIFSYDRMGDGVLTNWKCTRDISYAENTSFDAIADFVTATNEPTNGNGDDETLLLKLYDPEGICRKIGGAPNDSLTIEVEYEFGETTIKAVATRRRKCGITLVDNQDLSMTYGKSPYYEEMHRDQKALFEQRMDEFCPYPLGIKTNEPVGRWVFGFHGQSCPMYESGRAYSKGELFGYVIDEGKCSNYVCNTDITADENTSFEAISGKVSKSSAGGPMIDSFAEMTPPYIDVRRAYSEYSIARTEFIGKNPADYTTLIPPKCMFVGLDNGMYKIFKNTTSIYFMVRWANVEDELWGDEGRSNVNWYGADTTSMETHLATFGRIAREKNCPVIPYRIAITPQPDTYYGGGVTMEVNGELRTFNNGITTGKGEVSTQSLIDASVPEAKAGIHEWYPYTY